MDIPRLNSSVRSVTILQKDSSGVVAPLVIYQRRRGKKRKSTALLKPFEAITRRVVDAQATTLQSYRSRHDRSNRKKKDGWVRDLPVNVVRASQRGAKALKINRLLAL
jgi:hypothetical protein